MSINPELTIASILSNTYDIENAKKFFIAVSNLPNIHENSAKVSYDRATVSASHEYSSNAISL